MGHPRGAPLRVCGLRWVNPRRSRFRAPRPTLPPPGGRGFVNVVIGEGASGALGPRGGRNPGAARAGDCLRVVRRWWGGHAAYYGQVGPRVVRKIGRPAMTRTGHL